MVSRDPTITRQAHLITQYLGTVQPISNDARWRVYEDTPMRIHTHHVGLEGYPDHFGETYATIQYEGVLVYDTAWGRLKPDAWLHTFSRLYKKAIMKAADDAFEQYLQSGEPKSA